MARHVTPNYGWIFADVGGDGDVWGTLHQDAWDAIDAQVKANADISADNLPLAGGTMLGLLTTLAAATGGAGFNLPHGVAPTAPADGDFWTQADGVYAHVNGTTHLLVALGHTHPFTDITGEAATAQIADDAVTLAKQAAGTPDVLQGFDASGDPAEVAIGAGLGLDAGVLSVDTPYLGFTEYDLGVYATSTVFSQAHSLGAYPSLIKVFLKCNSADIGYAVGDMVDIASVSTNGSASRVPAVLMNTTDVEVITTQNNMEITHKTSFIYASMAISKWNIIARVFP